MSITEWLPGSLGGCAPKTAHSRLIPVEELRNRCYRTPGVFLVRHVTEVVENHKPAVCKVAAEAPCVLRRDQAIAPAPDYECGQAEFGYALGQRTRLSLGEALHERLPITFAQGDGVVEIHQFRGDLTGVTVDIAHARFDDAARQSVPEELAYHE